MHAPSDVLKEGELHSEGSIASSKSVFVSHPSFTKPTSSTFPLVKFEGIKELFS